MSSPAATDLAVIRELDTLTAEKLWVKTGFNAVAGHPLPDGLLPVGTGDGMVLMTVFQWQAYRELCACVRAGAACSVWPAADDTAKLEAVA